jgi:hypothetical protein
MVRITKFHSSERWPLFWASLLLLLLLCDILVDLAGTTCFNLVAAYVCLRMMLSRHFHLGLWTLSEEL